MTRTRIVKKRKPPPVMRKPSGAFHLLAVGVNQYKHHDNLKTAVNDANTFTCLMQEKYDFKSDNITLLENEDATADNIDTAFRSLLSTGSTPLTEDDFLLVWLSGHGEDDEDGTKRSYFIPFEGGPEGKVSTWIDFEIIKGYFSNIKAKQILLISDSCFSGGAFRKTHKNTSRRSNSYISKVIKKKGRQAITSGGLEEVADEGFDGHSVFASAIIGTLRENKYYGLSAGELFEAIKEPISLNEKQTPQFGTLYKTGSFGGEFIFFNYGADESLKVKQTVAEQEIDEHRKKKKKKIVLNFSIRKYIKIATILIVIFSLVTASVIGFNFLSDTINEQRERPYIEQAEINAKHLLNEYQHSDWKVTVRSPHYKSQSFRVFATGYASSSYEIQALTNTLTHVMCKCPWDTKGKSEISITNLKRASLGSEAVGASRPKFELHIVKNGEKWTMSGHVRRDSFKTYLQSRLREYGGIQASEDISVSIVQNKAEHEKIVDTLFMALSLFESGDVYLDNDSVVIQGITLSIDAEKTVNESFEFLPLGYNYSQQIFLQPN